MDKNNDQWVEKRLAALQREDDWQPNVSRGFAQLRERHQATRTRARRWGWVAAATVAAALPLMAFPTTRAFAQRCVSACVGQSNRMRDLFVSRWSYPALNGVYAKPNERRLAPDFVLSDQSGKAVKLSDFRGKVVLLNFWATWCAPCGLEIPWFSEFQNAHRDAGFTVLGVSLDEDGWTAVKPYIIARKVAYPVILGNDALAQQYGAISLPTTFIIDKSGRIAATHVGICGRSEYEADISAVLNERQ
jgi:peroxiredoxin